MVALEKRHLYLAHLLLMLAAVVVLETPQMEQAGQVAAVRHLVALVQQTLEVVAVVWVHQVLVALGALALSSSATLVQPNKWLVVLSPSLVVMSSTHSHRQAT
jgi:hypothetical protein